MRKTSPLSYFRYCTVGVFLLLGVSCSFGARKNVFVEESETLDVETISEQLDQTLSDYPVTFRVSTIDAARSFDRALYFFKTYTSARIPTETSNLTILTNKNTKDTTWYKVQRSSVAGGVRYTVSVERGTKPLLAQNLSRFIAEGQLELSLLESGSPR